MKRILIYFLILLIAVWLGLKIQADPGYVLIVYRSLSIETTLWFAILGLIIVFLVIYFLLRVLHISRILPKRLLLWLHKQSEQKAIRLTNTGIFKLADNDWSQAEKLLIKAARVLSNPLLNYVKAAYAADQQRAYRRRDSYLSRAYAVDKDAEMFIGIVQAKMQLKSHQFEQALATLKRLYEIKPNHKIILKLLKEVYFELHDWQMLKDLLKPLERRDVLSEQNFYELKVKVYSELLQESFIGDDLQNVQKFWRKIPKDLYNNDVLVGLYAKYLASHHLEIQAEQLIYDALSRNWSPRLLDIYPKIISEQPVKQLALVEKWLRSHSDDANLLLCLGRMCKNLELWGKARNYLEKSIRLNPKAETYLELGEVIEKYGVNEEKAASECYRKGLALLAAIKN